MIMSKDFDNKEDLCEFVNKEEVKVISIIKDSDKFILFYGKKE